MSLAYLRNPFTGRVRSAKFWGFLLTSIVIGGGLDCIPKSRKNMGIFIYLVQMEKKY